MVIKFEIHQFHNYLLISLIFQVFEGPVKKADKFSRATVVTTAEVQQFHHCVLISLDNKDFSQHACDGFLN